MTGQESNEYDAMVGAQKERLHQRFWKEFMEPAALAGNLNNCDPAEMALFAYLVGVGIPWDVARQAENLDLLEMP